CISFFFSSRRRHTRFSRDWSSDVCSSDLAKRRDCKHIATSVSENHFRQWELPPTNNKINNHYGYKRREQISGQGDVEKEKVTSEQQRKGPGRCGYKT